MFALTTNVLRFCNVKSSSVISGPKKLILKSKKPAKRRMSVCWIRPLFPCLPHRPLTEVDHISNFARNGPLQLVGICHKTPCNKKKGREERQQDAKKP